MTSLDIVNAFLALLIVLGLIGAVAWLVRRTGGLPGIPVAMHKKQDRRLKVKESINLDARHRLVLISRDNNEHLLLLGPGQDLIIETNINSASSPTPAAKESAK